MKDKSIFINTIKFLSLILLYYIYDKSNLFLYAITLSLYNVYISCFSHITLKNTFKKITSNTGKFIVLKNISIIISLICLLFVVISYLLSESLNIFLGLENTFLPYLLMSISVITTPMLKILLDYLESYDKPKIANRLVKTFYILDIITLLLIGFISVVLFKAPTYISVSLLYLSKIFSFILVFLIIMVILNKLNINFDILDDKCDYNYKKEFKNILVNNSHKSIIEIVKNGYYYISIVILYMVLSSRYGYDILMIESDITFVYLFGLSIINFIVDLIIKLMNNLDNKFNAVSYTLQIFQSMMKVSIILSITSPLICKILFNDNSYSIYLFIVSFLSIFISLYKVTYESINNKKIIYIGLIVGILTKLIMIVPLINSFYRMGYNLICGDIVSTVISMLASIVINYIYLKGKNKKEKTLEKVMTIIYESMILCIVLVILQFIIPTKIDGYFLSILVLGIYLFVSIMFFNIKKKRRG